MKLPRFERISENRYCTEPNRLLYQFTLQLLKVVDKDKEVRKRIINMHVYKNLRRRYYRLIADRSNAPVEQNLPAKKAFIYWAQGFDNAPLLVQTCLESVKLHLKGYEIIELDDGNIYDYIQFPPHIVRKIEAGLIHYPHKSDLLRLELLIKYGGLWLDSTLFATGAPREYMTEKPLFLYSAVQRENPKDFSQMRNWFIASGAGNRILIATRDLLYEYWRRNDHPVSYVIFHMFFTMATELYPEDWANVPNIQNNTLNPILHKPFDAEQFAESCKANCFHKLYHYALDRAAPGTLCDVLIRGDLSPAKGAAYENPEI